MFVCQHCGQISSTRTHKRAGNAQAWAIGQQQSNGFHVRRVVWGLLMAQSEKRIDEEIRAALITVEAERHYRKNVLPPDVEPVP